MALESVHDSPFGLADILFFAGVASDAVNYIVRFTGDIFHSLKLSAMMTADYVAAGVNLGTVSANFLFTNICCL